MKEIAKVSRTKGNHILECRLFRYPKEDVW